MTSASTSYIKHLTYEERLHQLRLWTLEERRNRADLIEIFEMAHGLSAIPLDEICFILIYLDELGVIP